ncbi:hypothetical protein [Oceanobacillus salinisoli]|uniref:hypothetical protein n=1 Tax=Oceanobacillus salinisoli TaxID=2678611 RepID=UPI0012E0ECC1|nr:hypothetical protein [Oceanobacillus salinisoli]
MQLTELINKINTCTDELDFVSTRKYIEGNINLLEDYRHLLNRNAREIFDFIFGRFQTGYKPLTRNEFISINTINDYARNLNVREIRIIVREKPELFIREDITNSFTKDAKKLLIGMGVIK